MWFRVISDINLPNCQVNKLIKLMQKEKIHKDQLFRIKYNSTKTNTVK
jgi:hypothetical protein